MSEAITPAGELREAARLMRERAGRIPQYWRLLESQIVAVGTDSLPGTDVIGSCQVRSRAEYVVSMHPGVALAVADWLEMEAAEYDELPLGAQRFLAGDGGGGPFPGIAVARAYVGTEGMAVADTAPPRHPRVAWANAIASDRTARCYPDEESAWDAAVTERPFNNSRVHPGWCDGGADCTLAADEAAVTAHLEAGRG